MTRDIQDTAVGHYSAIFRKIQNLMQCLHMQKPVILRILEYSELSMLTHIQNPVIFTKFTNIQDSEIFKTWHILKTFSKDVFFFAKTVKNYNYFYKVRLLRSSTGFWIYLSLNKYPLPQWSYASCMINIENPIYYCKLRHIQPYISTFRTLPYLESCHILNPRYIQNSAKAYSSILRTL